MYRSDAPSSRYSWLRVCVHTIKNAYNIQITRDAYFHTTWVRSTLFQHKLENNTSWWFTAIIHTNTCDGRHVGAGKLCTSTSKKKQLHVPLHQHTQSQITAARGSLILCISQLHCIHTVYARMHVALSFTYNTHAHAVDLAVRARRK